MDKQRSLTAVRYLILQEKSRLKTWRDIAEVFGISCGMAWRKLQQYRARFLVDFFPAKSNIV